MAAQQLEGEAIALRADATPLSFQLTMRRFGRKLEVDAMRRELPLSVFFFDCLMRDGTALVDRPATERFRALEESCLAKHSRGSPTRCWNGRRQSF